SRVLNFSDVNDRAAVGDTVPGVTQFFLRIVVAVKQTVQVIVPEFVPDRLFNLVKPDSAGDMSAKF
ncbi:unnamed protein product, partial [marine sediment metagenome]